MKSILWATDIIEREVRRGNIIVVRLSPWNKKHISAEPAARKPVRMRCGRSSMKAAITAPPYVSTSEFCLPCYISFRNEFGPKVRWS